MTDPGRPACYPAASAQAKDGAVLPSLDVLISPVPSGRFDSPVDHRHVLCLHLGAPVPVTYRAGRVERCGTRLHGQFCVVPAGASTRWTLSDTATSLLLRLSPAVMRETAESSGASACDPAPAIHVRDAQIERIGWLMQAESDDGYPTGRLFADGLAWSLAARLRALQSRKATTSIEARRTLPAWRLQRVIDYVEANLDADLALEQLANVAGFAVSHFTPLFKNATGMTPHRFVMQRRVERARLMLRDGRATITEVAHATGFAHASHMARCLRQLCGVTPGQIVADRR
ncbi:AraC family transcriptional regulator [Lysobacter sp. TY2-98]|uniref:helix-turn-helix domain-containing protein n=1 Tax=Lysobacter sp. TY2-98 TaxID=2290922 RepID=UPI000E1FF300|nr:AraC family transcriptional regulator [Lysobacter sp. TY2-98]AXK72815.1 AraC family transcriptional regulator [Lysobacter sp. TY2-98]